MNKNKGFTLIELLVVIAIIGILSSIVVSSVNQARDKGNDAAIKANLSGIRSQAAMYFDNNGQSYGAVSDNSCSVAGSVFADTNITSQINAAKTASGAAAVATCYNTSTAWAVSVPLRATGVSWCVDSTGKAASSTAGSASVCL
ncbi:MAG: type II secretion system protein [Patescibacteria group bacterium]